MKKSTGAKKHTRLQVPKGLRGTVIQTSSARQTVSEGFQFAKGLLKCWRRKNALVIALQGELGSGKTTFLQGLAKGFGVKERITSPTFIIFRKLKISSKPSNSKFQTFYHFDCYRLENGAELYDLGWEKIIKNSKAIVAVEWADRVFQVIPKGAVCITFRLRGKTKREIQIENCF
jgi:tRNA threonylcarbamoyladenosine biosynthesis protein TsaE